MSESRAGSRLANVGRTLAPQPPIVGTLKFGDIEYDIPEASNPSYLPHGPLLDMSDPFTRDNLYFMLQKYLLGQDIFLLSEPGPYARRLAMTFSKMINSEYEYVAIHRDCGERELKQAREIRAAEGSEGKTILVFSDSPTVRAIKHGRLLILEGIERAERGILPILSNILENREMNLEDGTHIIHPHRMALLGSGRTKGFISAHKNFRVIAIGAPTDVYPGLSLDPPFRSRFQARFINPLQAATSLPERFYYAKDSLPGKLRDFILLSNRISLEDNRALKSLSLQASKPIPQTALWKLQKLFSLFPTNNLDCSQITRLLLTIHPELSHAPPSVWSSLSRQLAETGLPGPLNDSSQSISGLLGYSLIGIQRVDSVSAELRFSGPSEVSHIVPAGPLEFTSFPLDSPGLLITPRFDALLTDIMIAHCTGWDISLVPPAALATTGSTSASTLLRIFCSSLGYSFSSLHIYKDITGRELIMRRVIENNGATGWAAQPLVEAIHAGEVAHLEGVDILGSTAGILSRLTVDRELDLWEGMRLVTKLPPGIEDKDLIRRAHPSARIVTTASKSMALQTWLTAEHANTFFTVPLQPMSTSEEFAILSRTGLSSHIVTDILAFAQLYRTRIINDDVTKGRRLGTRTLLRIAKRMKEIPQDSLKEMFDRALHAEFLPLLERDKLEALYSEAGLDRRAPTFYPSPHVQAKELVFPAPTNAANSGHEPAIHIPLFDPITDPHGHPHIPHLDHFYDNSMQNGCMRDIAIDLEVMNEHLVILGNQGVGKNKVVDRLCQLFKRPREYVQLHTDTTPMQLMLQAFLENGNLRYESSPLLRAVEFGRVIMIDEADKASEHVTAIFRSLATHGELSLPDGRKVRRARRHNSDIVLHPKFRMIILANRPAFPFLGNNFVQVLGEGFAHHILSNPDSDSEKSLLSKMAPELEHLIPQLVCAFQDLRAEYNAGNVGYPYSLRELLHLVRHLHTYPRDSVENALRNTFDFDVYKVDAMHHINEILRKHGLVQEDIGLERLSDSSGALDVAFEPKETSLDEPKEGVHDDEEHSGGNTFAGGTGGRDTSGVGGRGGYKRFWKGGPIKQVSEELKEDVPEHIKEKARKMAQEELAARLRELDLSPGDARQYEALYKAVEGHLSNLLNVFENLAAKEKERVWLKQQLDGELDDNRLVEGLTGEKHVYKRRAYIPPDAGRPQLKPKRIRFLFDLSASMYRFQYDGRLKRSLETAVMLMEVFTRLSRKDKYAWDMKAHSGDGPDISLIDLESVPDRISERSKVVQKMKMLPEYAFAGDYTLEAIHNSVKAVSEYDADDWYVIALTDANFERYNITADQLSRAMKANKKVKTALICMGEGAETPWLATQVANSYQALKTSDIPVAMRSILTTLLEQGE